MPGLMGIEAYFNGTIDVQGQKIQVKNGQADFQGQTYKVSKEGQVSDPKGQMIGRVDNGKFTPMQ